ncbi:MAG TPA: ankyrin repeat domain-containing protein [Terriglobia bacterium]|nr:ankyrin repeat domain-containing protein [Terriglobia bacterium]
MARVVRLIGVLLAVAVLVVSIVGAAGDSPVTKAAKSGDVAAMRKLITSKVDVNERSGDGSTPLLWATHNSDIEMVKVLIAAGAKADVANNYGVTPLLDASRTGDAAMIEVLLKAGADPKRTHTEGETPLMAASRSGNVAAVRLLLDRGVDVNATDAFQKQTALMWAAAEGHTDVVDALLNAGADPNRKAHVTSLTERKNADHPTGGFTALMWAARNGHEDTAKRLVQGKADMTLKNGDGATATMVAIYNDRFDMAKVLLDIGADPNDGSLYVAVEMRDSTTDQFAFDGSRLRPNHPNKLTSLDLIDILLTRGADPYKTFSGQFHSTSMPNSDRFDNSPFFRSAVASDAEALKVFIKHKIDVDKTPIAPVAAAAAEGAAPAAPPAGGRGARGNPNAGRTATMVTMTGGRGPQMTGGPGYIRSGTVPYREPGSRKPEDAFAVLVEGGANPNAKAPDGNSLLHMAAQANNLEMIKALAKAGVKFDQTNNNGLTALDVVEGRQPAGGAPARGSRAGAPPPAPGGRGRGARGGATPQDVAKLLRELMGLPPAPPSAVPATAPAAVPAVPTPDEEGDQQ